RHRGALATTTATGGLGEGGADEPLVAGGPVQLARELTGTLPRVLLGQHLAPHELGRRGAQRPQLVGAPVDVTHRDSFGPVSCAGSRLVGMSTRRERSHSARPLAWGSKRAL